MRILEVVAFVLLVVLFGCQADEKEPGTITISFLDTEDKNGAWAEVIADFERKNPAIKVELVEGPASTDTRESMYATSLLAKDATYDLIYLDVVWVSKFAAAGWLVPLDDRFSAEMQEPFLPGDIEASIYDGHVWRVPIRSNGGMLYYRKDLLDQAGFEPPKTFEELVAVAEELQSPPDLWGFVFQGKQYEGLTCVFLEILRGFGGEVIGPDGTCILGSPESVAALEWLRDAVFVKKIVPEAVRTYEENEALASFLSGKSVFMRNWPYAWKLCQEEESAIRGRVGIIPMVHAPGKESSATHGGWGFGISAFSEHKEEAWKFAWHAASPKSMKTFARRQGGTPALKALYEDPELLALYPHYGDLFNVLIHVRPRPIHPRYPQISDTLQRHVSAVLSGAKTPEEAIHNATGEIQAELERRK